MSDLSPWILLLVAPFIGSFLGVLVRRLPQGRPVTMVRSQCESCAATLAPRDLVPLLSFAVLRGRCRQCGVEISAFHPAIELAALGVAGCAVWVNDGSARAWAGCVLGWTLLGLAWIDLRTLLLPDVLTLPLLLAGLVATWLLSPELVALHAAAAAAGYLLFRGVGWTYLRLRGREGLGQGDAKLLAAGAAWVGPDQLAHVILGAALVGICLALPHGARLSRHTRIPFGPSLAVAVWLVWLLQ